MTEPSEMQQAIQYASPKRREEPNPALAMLLCLPGAICWATFLGLVFGRHLPASVRANLRWLQIFGDGPLLLCWLAAVATAIVSLIAFRRSRKPWYVWLNLVVNVTGLLFTILILGIALVALPFLDLD
jgi:hypothetical protein